MRRFLSFLSDFLGVLSFGLQFIAPFIVSSAPYTITVLTVSSPFVIYDLYSKVEVVEDISVELKYIREHVESLTQYPQNKDVLEELKDIQAHVESLTQHPQDMDILEELKDIRKQVESLTQHVPDTEMLRELKDIGVRVETLNQDFEGMRRNVKALDEERRSLLERVKEMSEN